jgi:hypothetical protein
MKPIHELPGWQYLGWKEIDIQTLCNMEEEAFSFVADSWFLKMSLRYYELTNAANRVKTLQIVNNTIPPKLTPVTDKACHSRVKAFSADRTPLVGTITPVDDYNYITLSF